MRLDDPLEGRLLEIRQRSNCDAEIAERWRYGSEAIAP
jgi:hypothetical protein